LSAIYTLDCRVQAADPKGIPPQIKRKGKKGIRGKKEN